MKIMRGEIFWKGVMVVSFISFMLCTKIASVYAEYDNTYVLAIKQKYAIPENINKGDYVGIWLKTWTWKSQGSISYNIKTNYRDAFAINGSTGLLTINNANHINGKIVLQDTVIIIIIRTTDNGTVSEDDTCEIRIKENAYCKFIDLDAGNSGTGTKASPYNSPADFTTKAGYGYFFKRATSFSNAFIDLQLGLIASSAHPVIFGAYGTGDNPQFNGKDGGNNFFSYLGNWDYPKTRQCEYIYWYDLTVRNYPQSAWYTVRISDHLGWYNCIITNCDKKGTASSSFTLINEFPDAGSISDSSRLYDFEIINAYFDTTGTNCTSGCEKSFIKGAQGALIENCYFGQIRGTITGAYQIRLSQGSSPVLKHCWFENIPGTHNDYGYAHIQLRADHARIIDCIFNGFGNGIYVTSPGTAGNEVYPDDLLVKNCYFQNMDYSGIFTSPGEGDAANHSTGNTIEDCRFINVPLALSLRDWDNSIIRRNLINGSGANGIVVRENAVNLKISYNIIYGFTTNQINLSLGSGHTIYNNTADGLINCTGTNGVKAYNNYAKAFEKVGTSFDNLDIDNIITADHFVNYNEKNFRLKITATSAINEGSNNGVNVVDFAGNSLIGLPDIGANEYIPAGSVPVVPSPNPVITENTAPVMLDQVFTVREENFKNQYIGKVLAKDNDNNQVLTFSITSGNGSGVFSINSINGDLTTTSSKIFGPGTISHKLIVKATDNAREPKSVSAAINVKLVGISDAVYIDPGNTNDLMASGTFDHPLDSWDDVTWKEGSTYLQKRGTKTTTNKILIGANKVTLGAYGEGESPVISSQTNTYLISGFEKSGIRIGDLNLQAPNAVSCIYFLGNSADIIIIEHCELKANANAIKVVGGSSLVTKYNTITSNHEGIYSTAVSNEIYYNIFKSCNTAVNVVSNSSKANIYNNVFFDNEKSLSMSYAELTLYNNIFYMTTPGQMAISHGTGNIESDHNIFYPEQAGFITIANTQFNNLDELQKSLKIDMNSFNADPLFVDIYNENFSLASGSPAINAGVDLQLGIDYQGSTVPLSGGTDIGINEFTGPIIPSKKPNEKSVMTLYPNPSSGQISILAELKQDVLPDDPGINQPVLQVVDISGKAVFSKRLENQNTSTIQDDIDLSGISNGLYFVVLHIADKVLKEKLIITR